MSLLDNGGAVRREETRFESNQQLMQGRERRQRNTRRADFVTGASDRVELPCRQDRDDARRQLDVHEIPRRAPLALDATRATPIERVPAIVDYDILPDMGRMTVRLR